MPSGSHFGSPGSHSSGGASRGGSSSSNSSTSSTRFTPFFSTIFIGRGLRTAVPQKYRWISALSTFAFFVAIIVLMIGLVLIPASDTDKIEADYAYYQDMIAYAEENQQMIRQATVTDRFLNEDCGKYYITYSVPMDSGIGDHLIGYSFSVYTLSNAPHIGTQIDVAVNSETVTLTTDSIPMDFKDIPLSEDGEYIVAVQNRETRNILFIVSAVCFAGGIALYITLTIKTRNDYNSQKASHPAKAEKAPTPEATETPSTNFDDPFAKDYFKCPKCGADVLADQKYCPLCGTKLKK